MELVIAYAAALIVAVSALLSAAILSYIGAELVSAVERGQRRAEQTVCLSVSVEGSPVSVPTKVTV